MRISENRRSLELAILLTPIGPFRRISMGVGFLGIELEGKRNAANEDMISAAASRVAVRVIHTDEERMIAETVCRVLELG